MNNLIPKNIKKNVCLLLLFYCSVIATQPKTIIFDLGGVLFYTKTPISIMLKHVTLKTLIQYLINPYTPKYGLKQQTLSFLHKIKERSKEHIFTDLPVDEHGSPLPLIMEEWLSGSLSSQDALAFIHKTTQNNPLLFNSRIEKRFMLKIAQLIFNPDFFIETQQIHPHAIKSIKQLKAQGFNVYALSNWDKESFTLMRKQHDELFGLFDGIMISGEEGMVKPSSDFYHYFLTKYNLDPAECIFIDDQHVNIDAAKKLGIHSIVCPTTKKYFFKKTANLKVALKQILSHVQRNKKATI